MNQKLLLIDFENIQQINLSQVDENTNIIIFLGAGQKSVPFDFELNPKSSYSDDPNYKRVLDILGKSGKKTRPRKLKTLSQYISSIYQKKIDQEEIEHIIDMLFANKMITETNNTISYAF